MVKLKGVQPQKLKVLKGESSLKLLQNGAQLCMLELRKKTAISISQTSMEQGKKKELVQLQDLKEQHADIFQEPNKSPPDRGVFYHRIPLKSGANPLNLGHIGIL